MASVVQLLETLVDKSLVVAEERDGHTRYTMLDTVREYAGARLTEEGEGSAPDRPKAAADVRDRHLSFYLDLARQARPHFGWFSGGRIEDRDRWVELLEAEHENVQAALRWTIDSGQIDAGLELTSAVSGFWIEKTHLSEGRRWLEDFLSLGGSDVILRGKANAAAGEIAWVQHDYAGSSERYREAVQLLRQGGDEREAGKALSWMGWAHFYGNYPSEAYQIHEEAVGIMRRVGDEFELAGTLRGLAWSALSIGDGKRALALDEEALALLRKAGNKRPLASHLGVHANILQTLGDLGRAAAIARECVQTYRELGDKRGLGGALGQFAGYEYMRGRYDEAHELSTESLGIARELKELSLTVTALRSLAHVAFARNDLALARTLLLEAIDEGHRITDPDQLKTSQHERRLVLDDLGALALLEGKREEAKRCWQDSLAARRATGKREVAAGLAQLADLADDEGDLERALALREEALAVHERLDDKAFRADSLLRKAQLAWTRADPSQAVSFAREAVLFAEETGVPGHIDRVSRYLSELLYRQGALSEARALLERNLLNIHGYGPQRSTPLFELLAAVFASAGDLKSAETSVHQLEPGHLWRPEARSRLIETLVKIMSGRPEWQGAARLLGAAEGHRDRLRTPRPEWEHAAWERCVAEVRTSLGEERFAAAFDEGRALTFDEAMAFALEPGDDGGLGDG